MNSTVKLLAIVGVVAVIGFGVYAINESGKSDAEKIGDRIEDVGEAVDDAINNSVD